MWILWASSFFNFSKTKYLRGGERSVHHRGRKNKESEALTLNKNL